MAITFLKLNYRHKSLTERTSEHMYYVFRQTQKHKNTNFNLCNFEELLECNRHYHKARQLMHPFPLKPERKKEREREIFEKAGVGGKRNGGGGTVNARCPENLTLGYQSKCHFVNSSEIKSTFVKHPELASQQIVQYLGKFLLPQSN